MKASENAFKIIKKYEGCRLICYADIKGVPTIGYGHTKGLTQDDVNKKVITAAEADEFLRQDIVNAEGRVNKYYSKYHWTQDEFDALVSFAFNIGNIDQLTNNGIRSKDVIAEKILEYNKCNHVVVTGLTVRRTDEHSLFIRDKEVLSPMTGIMTFSLKNDGDKQISEHFKIREFKCKDGSDEIKIDVDFVMNELEMIRNFFKRPVIINSAYRTPAYNKKVGGATNSYHMKGQAFDIAINGYTPDEVAKAAFSIGCGGIIRYNTFTHVDSRTQHYFAINDNGKVTKVTKF